MTSQQVAQEKSMTIGQFFASKKSQIQLALPKHLDADRMLRIVMTELRKTPKLRDCTSESLFGAVIQASQLGLEPGGALGHAFLIPYGKECQFMVGYRGLLDLARRSGEIKSIYAQYVGKNDKFKVTLGLHPNIEHEMAEGERGELIAVYAVAHFKDGGYQFEVMLKSEIEKVRSRSKAAKNGPWITDYEEMSKKTVLKRLSKYLPVSIEAQRAANMDDLADEGMQGNDFIFDNDTGEVLNNTKSKADNIANELESSLNQKEAEKVEISQEAKEYFGEE
jgi:recombination protein RecT